MKEFRFMAILTRPICIFLCLTVLFGQISAQSNRNYEQALDEINARLKYGQDENDLAKIAQAYYDRSQLNFGIHLGGQDVIGDLIESAKLYKYLQDDANFFRSRKALAAFYIREDIFLDEAIEITAEAYQYFAQNNLGNLERESLRQLGKAYQSKLEYEKAISYVDKSLANSIEAGDFRNELLTRYLMVELFNNLGNVEKVVEQGELTLALGEKYGLNIIKDDLKFVIGKTLHRDGQIEEAKKYLLDAQASNDDISELGVEINMFLSELYFSLDSVLLAYDYLKRADNLKNELYEKEKYARANQIAAKYQTREKDKEIKQLEEGYQLMDFKLTQRTRFLIILATILALGAFSAFNYYRLQKHRFETEKLIANQKEEISSQKINELENTLKIKNLEAMVNGQEAERSRIAAELHDSLGGTLSALKLQYDTLQLDHGSLSEDADYNRILGLIDDACKDVRDISRNLKPIALENLGLTAALKDLVNRYSTRGTLDISLHLHNVDGILDSEGKLHVYRIIQELLTNAIRHAQATEIDIQINKSEEEMVIIIEDNGCGFDIEQIKKGLGLGNLESRINVIHGNMEIDSRVGYGTSFVVRIPIENEVTA